MSIKKQHKKDNISSILTPRLEKLFVAEDRLGRPDVDDREAPERSRKKQHVTFGQLEHFRCREDLGGAEGQTKENSDSKQNPKSQKNVDMHKRFCYK